MGGLQSLYLGLAGSLNGLPCPRAAPGRSVERDSAWQDSPSLWGLQSTLLKELALPTPRNCTATRALPFQACSTPAGSGGRAAGAISGDPQFTEPWAGTWPPTPGGPSGPHCIAGGTPDRPQRPFLVLLSSSHIATKRGVWLKAGLPRWHWW